MVIEKSTDVSTSSNGYALPENMPSHVAIIMDGNGRWAKKRGLPRQAGHRAGAENLRRIISAAGEVGKEIIIIYSLHQGKWGRPKTEDPAVRTKICPGLKQKEG